VCAVGALPALFCHEQDTFTFDAATSGFPPTDRPTIALTCAFGASGRKQVLAVGDEAGSLSLFHVDRTLRSGFATQWIAHPCPVLDCCWTSTDEIVTASGDSSLKSWDVTTEVTERLFAINRWVLHARIV